MALPKELAQEVARIQHVARSMEEVLADWSFAMPDYGRSLSSAVESLHNLGENLQQAVEGNFVPPEPEPEDVEKPPEDLEPQTDAE